jgi:hypothetical protein
MAQFKLNELNAETLDLLSSEDHKAFIENNPFVAQPDALSIEESLRLFGKKKKPEPFKNEELPESFKNRTFIKNLSALTYKLEEIPGHIVKYDADKKDYKIVSLTRLVKDNQYPETTIVEDGMLYSGKINSGASFNGSFLIGGLKVDTKSIMELIIQDVMVSIVPDELMLKEEIKAISDQITAENKAQYYFIKGTTLTLVNNKKFKEQKFEAKVNITYVTAEGKVFASNEKFSRERLVSLDLIPLNDLII